MTHYEYQKKIAHVWLDKDFYKKNESPSYIPPRSVASSLTSNSMSSRKSRISDSSVHPLNGLLRYRLDRLCGHWPTKTSAKHNCQLHHWACGKRTYKNVSYCKDCNVCLCTECYEIFYTEWDLLSEKGVLRRKYCLP